jgi:hypothetical protein
VVKDELVLTHNLTGEFGLLDAATREIDVGPAGKKSSSIPEAFTMT